MHKILTYLPVLIIWYGLLSSLFLVDTNFYANNFYTLDAIDTLLVFVSVTHSIFFCDKYRRYQKRYLQAIYFLVLLSFVSDYFIQEIYYYLYYAISITFIILAFWKNAPRTRQQ